MFATTSRKSLISALSSPILNNCLAFSNYFGSPASSCLVLSWMNMLFWRCVAKKQENFPGQHLCWKCAEINAFLEFGCRIQMAVSDAHKSQWEEWAREARFWWKASVFAEVKTIGRFGLPGRFTTSPAFVFSCFSKTITENTLDLRNYSSFCLSCSFSGEKFKFCSKGSVSGEKTVG